MQVLMLSFFILTIVFTLIFADFLIAHNTIAIAAFAKKKSSDKANGIAADASNSLRPEANNSKQEESTHYHYRLKHLPITLIRYCHLTTL
jgi:hypothetical protein